MPGTVGTSIPKVVGSIPTGPGIFFKLARCGYTFRVTYHKHHIHLRLSTQHQHRNNLKKLFAFFYNLKNVAQILQNFCAGN
jgi:hypothetical protein